MNNSAPPDGSAQFRDPATQALLERLGRIAAAGKTLFGMANATTLSYKGGFRTPPDVSDCKDITGSHPAFIEDDFMWYSSTDPNFNASVTRGRNLEALRQAHQRGAICGYCWHMAGKNSASFRYRVEHGPAAGTLGSDATLAADIVAQYRALKASSATGSTAADSPHDTSWTTRIPPAHTPLGWLCGLMDTLMIPLVQELGFPLVFRPFHEMNGNWFWWGSDALSPEAYRDLYRLTVEYLRSRGLRNLLYAWSPNTPFDPRYYPGDSWVDIVGLDSYEPGAVPHNDHKQFVSDLHALGDFARTRGKLAALCETGCRKDGDQHRYPQLIPDFWSRCVLGGIKSAGVPLIWVMSWYQNDWGRNGRSQYYIPYKEMATEQTNGAQGIQDFLDFARDPSILLEDRLKDY